MKKTTTATRIKSISSTFALYRVNKIENLNFVNEEGKQLSKKQISALSKNNVIAVREIDFAGWAKGKTGRHMLDEPNTETIVVGTIRKLSDGKLKANDWYLINQAEINTLYSKRVAYNI